MLDSLALVSDAGRVAVPVPTGIAGSEDSSLTTSSQVGLLARPMLTVADMEEIFQCDARTLRRWEKNRVMPRSLRLRGRKYWSGAVISAWLQAGCPRLVEQNQQ